MSTESAETPESIATEEHDQFINARIVAREFTVALAFIEQIPAPQRSPLIMSAYALSLAEVKKDFKTAATICHDAIKRDPKNPEHYFRQGQIMFLAGRRKDCVWILRMGLRHGKHRGIVDALGALGIRRPPPIYFLTRENPLNKYIGLLLTKLNLR